MEGRRFLANYISLFLLLALTADALVADWRLDPIWNVLYARIQLNLFYNAHASSILAVCASAFWLIYKKDGIPVAVFAAFGTASIHELTLDFVDLTVFRISSGISWAYAVYLFAFLGIGFFISKPYHKRVWLSTFALMFVWFLILTALPHGSTIDPDVPFGASKDFYNPLVNVEEVASWLVPTGLWFLPRRWFWKSQQ